MKRFIAMAAIPAAVLATGIFAISSPAHAAAPPSCVSWARGSNAYSGTIVNNCGPEGSSQRVRVTWQVAPDSACYTVAAHSRKNVSSRLTWARYGGLQSC